jgi:hypothetical protein
MDTSDPRLAKRRLHETNLNLVIVKKGKVVFETKAHGLSGFLLAIEKFGKELIGSSVADRIVGRAAALLCAYGEVASVFAVTLSKEGVLILRKNSILCEYENLVPNILNYDCTDVCPFEKLVAGLMSPKEAYLKLKQKTSSSMHTTP